MPRAGLSRSSALGRFDLGVRGYRVGEDSHHRGGCFVELGGGVTVGFAGQTMRTTAGMESGWISSMLSVSPERLRAPLASLVVDDGDTAGCYPVEVPGSGVNANRDRLNQRLLILFSPPFNREVFDAPRSDLYRSSRLAAKRLGRESS